MRHALSLAVLVVATPLRAEDVRQVYLENDTGERVAIATVTIGADDSYSIAMAQAPFTDHFLSMRPFRCVEGPGTHLCHVPYPYEIARNLSDDLVDLEYDLLFVWKGSTEYGINMWNGMYWTLEDHGDRLVGTLHEMDMDGLAVPPAAGELRPITAGDLEPADPDSHWLPRLVIE